MTGNMRQFDIRISTLPAMPIAQANAARHDLYNDTVVSRCRVVNLLDLRSFTKLSVKHCLQTIEPLFKPPPTARRRESTTTRVPP